MIQVETVGPANEAEYAAYLLRSPASLLYASLPYRNLIAEHVSAKPRYFLARGAGGEVRGVLPSMLSKPGPFGPVLNSLPYFGSNGGAIVHDGAPEVREALIGAFHRLAESELAAAATIVTSPFDAECEACARDERFSLRDSRIGQLTPLPEPGAGLDTRLMAMFEDPRPRNIRRAMKGGVTVERSMSPEAIDFLYQTHVDNISAIGGQTKSRSFFDSLPMHLGDGGFKVYVARKAGTPIGALLLLYYNETVEYFTPATVDEFRSDQPLSLVIYQAMLDAVAEGYRWWNWGGTWATQSGVYDFKKRWGTVDKPYHYYTRVLCAEVLTQTPAELLAAYPSFFVVPFAALAAPTQTRS